MYKYPDRKRYRYTIPTTKGDCVIIFDQATARETAEYLEILELLVSDDIKVKLQWIYKQKEYIYSFIDKYFPYKIRNVRKRQLSLLVKAEIEAYMWDILGLYHKLRKSIYQETQMPKVNGKMLKPYPFDNHYEVIAKKTWIPIDQLYDRLTTEQIWWYLDKIVYDSYENFPEGRAINAKIAMQKWLTKEQQKDLDIINSFKTKKQQ